MEYHIELHTLSLGREPPSRLHMTLIVRPSSDKPYVLRMERGLLGQERHTREWRHRSMADAVHHMREIVTTQRHAGFRVVTMSQNHPLRSWLDSEQVGDGRAEAGPSRKRREKERPAAAKAEQLSLFDGERD